MFFGIVSNKCTNVHIFNRLDNKANNFWLARRTHSTRKVIKNICRVINMCGY